MIVGLVLALAVAFTPQEGSLAPALADARVQSLFERVELGQPFTLELEVSHRLGSQPVIDPSPLEGDLAWMLFEGGERTTQPDPDRPGDALTRVSWRMAALEPGELELPAPGVGLESATGEEVAIEVARAVLEVRPVLAPGEDAARPLIGFVGLEPEAEGTGPGPLVLAALALALLAAAAFVWLKRRRSTGPTAPRAATPLEVLAELETRELDRPEAVTAAHYELTRALREHLDASAQAGASAQAWTDEEWLQHVGERFEGQQRERLEQLFADCAEVKYGGETPTHWAARERAEAARRLALELGAKGTALQVEPAQGANPPEEVAR